MKLLFITRNDQAKMGGYLRCCSL